MIHIGYQTHHLPTGRYYIGVHSTEKIDDGYLGSGRAFTRAVAKHGRHEFKRHDVRYFQTREEAEEWERETVTEAVANDPRSFNSLIGGQRGGRMNERLREEVSDNLRKRVPEIRESISKKLTGRKLSEETKARISAAKKGKSPSAEHKAKLSAAGKKRRHSAETKAKMAASQRAYWARKKSEKAS